MEPGDPRVAYPTAGGEHQRVSRWPRPGRTPTPPPLPPWWERHPRVFTGEMAELARLNRTPQRPALRAHFGPWRVDEPVTESNPVRLIVEGTVRIHAARPGEMKQWHSMRVEIGYPPTFPSDHPDVRPKDPALARRRHQMGRSRELCYVDEARQAWRPGRGLGQALDGAHSWLRGEVTGDWSGEVPASELLAYFDGHADGVRLVLIPEHGWRSPPTATRGTFDLEVSSEVDGPAILGALHARTPGRSTSGAAAASPAIRDTNDKLWLALDVRRREEPIRGLWFRLEREPDPFHDLAGLQSQLLMSGRVAPEVLQQAFRQLLDASATQRGWLPIALLYPARSAGAVGTEGSRASATEWLFVTLEWPFARAPGTKGSSGLRRAANRNPRLIQWARMAVRGLSAYDVSSRALRRRVGALYPAEPLLAAHVVIVGVGALGSTVARALAAAGIRYFTIVDPDVFKPGNVVRHELRLPDVGRGKAKAMRRVIIETNPYAEVTVISSGTRGEDREFERVLLTGERRPTLIISLTGIKAVEGQVDCLAATASPQIEVLHGWVYAHAQFLRAFLYRPGRTACTWCTDLYRLDAEEGQPVGYVLPPVSADAAAGAPFYEGGCGSPAHPGAGNANALAAHVLVEHALSCLEPGRVSNDATHWLYAGARVRDVDPAFPLDPLSQRVQALPPRADCHLCGMGLLDSSVTPEEQVTYETALAQVEAMDSDPDPTHPNWEERPTAATHHATLRRPV